MTGRKTDQAEDRLILRSRLSDIAQIPTWIGSLASRHAIPENIEFAINLCLEEAVSNIIRHGYGAQTDGRLIVRFTMPRQDLFVFTVEDEAPHFNPLDVLTPNPRNRVRVGGQGINFLRQFADTLEYERTPTGNRLRMVFSAANLAP
jgi:anti-sigma regulatory factor (Ser/Thr protein kinase)